MAGWAVRPWRFPEGLGGPFATAPSRSPRSPTGLSAKCAERLSGQDEQDACRGTADIDE
jgi:hypothetical protein